MLYFLIFVALIFLGVMVFQLSVRMADVENKTNELVNDQRVLNDRMDWLRCPETPQPKP